MATKRNMQQVARLGGLALKSKPAPAQPCECCGRIFPNWLSYLGHLGMRATAARFFNGDVTAAARQLAYNSLAKQEAGATWANGAWARRFRPVDPAGRIAELEEDLEHSWMMRRHAATETVREAARKSIELIEAELATLRGEK